ncbi:hypothetical protein BSKO_03930 [Bryopsis sp. KO-2023]|nr:hypothetical protein BSKO_03930 [Bryopsis sp. KO-2023]
MQDSTMQVGCAGLAAAFFASIYYYCDKGSLRPTLQNVFKWKTPNLTYDKLDSLVARVSNHIMSIIHCMIQIPLALYAVKQPELDMNRFHGTSAAGYACFAIGAGYFLIDVSLMLFRQYEGALLMMHGVFCFTLYTYGMLTGCMQYYGTAFILWECSTPFVHFRWLLSKVGKESSTAYVVNGIAMTIAFFVCRCVWGTYISYDFWVGSVVELQHPIATSAPAAVIWFIRVVDVALSLLNFYWFFLMLRKAAAFLTTPPPQKTS